jgi:hypothetical protein
MTEFDDESDTEALAPIVPASALIARHMRIGWGALVVFVTLGLTLEAMHAYKAAIYLDVGNETRRLMWTLAHAHGIGLSLLNIAYAATLQAQLRSSSRALELASMLTAWSTLLVPLGFLLGGVVTYGGDPSPGVFLVPIGAFMLWIAVILVTREVFARRAGSGGAAS